MYEASSSNRYATFFYGQYDPANHKFDYVNAGHNPPMLFRCAAGKWSVTRLDVGGTVVGLLESYPYQQGSVRLSAGDILVAFTDGISEAMNANDEEWGEDHLMKTIESCDGLGAQEIMNRVFIAADAFVAGATATRRHDAGGVESGELENFRGFNVSKFQRFTIQIFVAPASCRQSRRRPALASRATNRSVAESAWALRSDHYFETLKL